MAKTAKPCKSKPTKLKSSIKPGTVLILLAGRYRGKRVVFLKQLKSGLLLVTGPHKVNGVPLRRVNQAYVIATSTKVKVDAKLADKFDDSFFPGKKADKSESAERKKAQTEVDSALAGALKTDPVLGKYLK